MIDCDQVHIRNTSRQRGEIQFHGEDVIVDGEQVPYSKQVLTSQMFYITDLAMQVQISQQIDLSDQKYFLERLNKQIVSEIEVAHSSIGIQILQQMGNLGIKTYSYIFLKLSLQKIKNILMDNAFYIFISSACRKLINGKDFDGSDATQIETTLLNNLETPQKRILYLMDSLRRNQLELRPAIEQAALQLVFAIIGQANFIRQLGYKKKKSDDNFDDSQVKQNQQVIVNFDFLKQLCQIIKTLQSLAKTPREIKQVYQLSNKNMLSQVLFTKQCLTIIGKNFEHFFLYDRKRLMLVLSFLALNDNKQLWSQVINQKYAIQNHFNDKKIQSKQVDSHLASLNQEQSKQHESNIEKQRDNITFFTQLILSNFFGLESQTWDMSVFILTQLIQAKITQCSHMFTQIFLEIIENRLNTQDIALITQFIKNQVESAQSQHNQQIRLLVYTFMTHIGIQINHIFEDYRRMEAKKFAESKVLKIIQFTGCELLKFPKINSLQMCAFLRIFIVFFERGLLKWTAEVPYVPIVEKLLIMTKSRGGIISGVRKILIKQIEVFIASKESEVSQTVQVKQSSFVNQRKQLKSFRITLQRQNPNSLERLKRLLCI